MQALALQRAPGRQSSRLAGPPGAAAHGALDYRPSPRSAHEVQETDPSRSMTARVRVYGPAHEVQETDLRAVTYSAPPF